MRYKTSATSSQVLFLNECDVKKSAMPVCFYEASFLRGKVLTQRVPMFANVDKRCRCLSVMPILFNRNVVSIVIRISSQLCASVCSCSTKQEHLITRSIQVPYMITKQDYHRVRVKNN